MPQSTPLNTILNCVAMFLTIPTLMTWARIALIPLIVGVFYLPLSASAQNWIAAILFALVSITDWLDGYLARKLNQTSAFGAFLDPVADKFLVSACMLVLVDLGRADVFAALIIIGREIAISALREWMAQIGAASSVAVHMLGKMKTAVQMLAIPCLLLDAPRLLGFINTPLIGTLLLWTAVLLTVWSLAYYLQRAIPVIRASVSSSYKPK